MHYLFDGVTVYGCLSEANVYASLTGKVIVDEGDGAIAPDDAVAITVEEATERFGELPIDPLP